MTTKWGETESQRRIDRRISRISYEMWKRDREIPPEVLAEINFMREAEDLLGLEKLVCEGEQAIWIFRIYDWLPQFVKKRIGPI